MRILNTLRPGRRPARVCERNDIVFVGGKGLESIPALRTGLSVILQALQDGLIEGTGIQLICVRIHDKRHVGVIPSVRVEEGDKLVVDDNGVRVGVGEDVGDIVGFEAVVHGCKQLAISTK